MDHLETISEEMTSPDSPEVEAGKPPVPIPASDYLEDFQYRVLNNQQPPTISTGFKNLDASLGGGIFPGFYVIGANSSLGKTTLLCQIADQIAVFNQDILIFSLEMSREELIAKSISRLSGMLKQNNAFPTQEALSTRQILNGIDLSDRIEMLKISFGIYKKLYQ